jgi:hypothetical protein
MIDRALGLVWFLSLLVGVVASPIARLLRSTLVCPDVIPEVSRISEVETIHVSLRVIEVIWSNKLRNSFALKPSRVNDVWVFSVSPFCRLDFGNE